MKDTLQKPNHSFLRTGISQRWNALPKNREIRQIHPAECSCRFLRGNQLPALLLHKMIMRGASAVPCQFPYRLYQSQNSVRGKAGVKEQYSFAWKALVFPRVLPPPFLAEFEPLQVFSELASEQPALVYRNKKTR